MECGRVNGGDTDRKVNLAEARKILVRDGCTCVMVKGGEVFSSRERGVKPIMEFTEGGKKIVGFSAADKVVGKAAALLYALMRIDALYAEVISLSALRICRKYNIYVEYGALTDAIINRKGDGPCPMESAVEGTDDAETARDVICRAFKRLGAK